MAGFTRRQFRRIGQLLRFILRGVRLLLATVYYLIARSFFYVLTLALVLYFFLNSFYFSNLLNNVMAEGAMPGSLYMGQITWGPLPWRVQVFKVRIADPRKTPIIEAEYVRCSVNLYRLLKGLTANVVWGDNLLDLTITDVEVYNSRTFLAFDDKMRFLFTDAFSRHDAPPSKGEGLQVLLTMPDITLFGGTVHLRFPFASIDTRLKKLTAQVFLENNRVRVYGPRVSIKDGVMQFTPSGGQIFGKPMRFEWKDLEVGNFFTDGDVVRIPDGFGHFPLSPIRFAGEIWTRDPGKFDLRASLSLKEGDPLVTLFSKQMARGAINATYRMYGTMADVKANLTLNSPQLTVRGMPLGRLSLSGRFGKDFLANPKGEYQYRLERLSTDLFGGKLLVENARYKPLWTAAPPRRNGTRNRRRRKLKPATSKPATKVVLAHGLDLKARLREIQTEPLIRWATQSLSAKTVAALKKELPFLYGTLGGTLALSRTRNPNEISADLDLKMTQTRRAGTILNRKYALKGGIDLRFVPDPTRNTDFLGQLDHLSVAPRRLWLGSGRDFLLLSRGRVLPFSRQIESLQFRLESRRFREILVKYLAIRDLDGALTVSEGKVFGAFDHPTIRVKATLTKGKLLGVELEDVQTIATLRPTGMIQVARLSLKPKWAKRVTASGTVRLHNGSWSKISRTFPMVIPARKLHVDGLSIRKLALHGPSLKPILKKLPRSGTLSLTEGSISAWLSAFTKRLQIAGKFRAKNVLYEGEQIEDASALIQLDAKHFALRDVKLKLAGIDKAITGDLRYQRRSQRVDGQLKLSQLNLRRFRRRGMLLGGHTSLALKFKGTTRALRMEGLVSFRKLRYNAYFLGDATLRLIDKGPGRAAIVSTRFFHGLELQPHAQLRWKGLTPIGLRLSAVTPAGSTLSLSRIYSRFKTIFKRSDLAARLDLDLDLTRRVPFSAKLTIPRGGVRFQVENIAITNDNQLPASLSLENNTLQIKGLELQSYATDIDRTRQRDGKRRPTLTINGSLRDDNRLDFTLNGALNLGVLRSLDAISAVEGVVNVDLRVSGSLRHPQAAGRFTLGEISVVPRGFGREIVLSKGAMLVLGPIAGKTGWHALAIDEKHPIKGDIDGGTFEISGALDLKEWQPTNVLLKLSASDLEYKAPGEYEITLQTVAPHLTFTGENILDRRQRQFAFAGSIRLIQGQYFKRFDSLTSSFSQVFGGSRQVKRHSTPLDEVFPWIRRVKLGLSISGSKDFFVRTRFQFGRTDLELQTDLKVAGTYAKPAVTGQIKILTGTINYSLASGRRFELDEGKSNTITFSGSLTKPYVDVTAHTTITYEVDRISRRRFALDDDLLEGDEREEKVFIQIFGELDKLKYKLYAEAGRYDQQSLISLIVFGRPIDSQSTGTTLSLNISSELFSALPKLLLGAFVDEVSLGISEQLGVMLTVFKRVGSWLKLKARISQSGEQSKYQAGFKFKITDRLSLEGQFKINRKENTQQYDGKLKYTIPLN